MDTEKIMSLARDIEFYKKSLDWLKKYGPQLEKPGSYDISVRMVSAASCTGASEVRTLFEGIIREKCSKIVEETVRECEVGIGRCEEQIRELTQRP